ncbi:MAG: UDP-N-acetylmuramoyl-tripeptide--D-alanyl-D-alanine ligase [Clostridia bacterium]|nr:UDP-N-acetylmuramoyl-tripeptide--D-alanyl-D-alanine ligase [Clostridia bacterium]
MKSVFATKKLTLNEINEICGGRLICSGIEGDAVIDGICTDSREADEKTLFVAIEGEHVDGHDYILSAVGRGCPFSLASKMTEMNTEKPYGIILVEDTVAALGKIAKAYKANYDCFTVGVTGSVGKTTTKEFIAAVLSEKTRTFKTEGNHNSVIGMPLSMLEMPEKMGAAVLEMGMSGFGEISSMARAARPDVAVITTIGTSHMEQLGSRENICRAKMEITEGLSEDGVLILNGDEPLLVSADKGGKKVFYIAIENRDADCRALNIRMSIGKTVFDLLSGGRIYSDIEIPVMGQHNVYAALFAFSVGKLFGMDIEAIRRGLMNYRNIGMRQNIYGLGGITLIEDCYNASPESMRSAIDVMHELSEQKKGARTAALLGDMLELGENSPMLHREVGRYLARSGADLLFAYGPRAENIALAAIENGMKPENVYVNLKAGTPEITGDMMIHALKKDDILLVKASRSVAAEKVIEYLRENIDKLLK